jgi:hypothetical protein
LHEGTNVVLIGSIDEQHSAAAPESLVQSPAGRQSGETDAISPALPSVLKVHADNDDPSGWLDEDPLAATTWLTVIRENARELSGFSEGRVEADRQRV